MDDVAYLTHVEYYNLSWLAARHACANEGQVHLVNSE